MTRRDLAARLAALTGLTLREISCVLEALPEVVAQVLAQDQQLHWRGLGSFTVRRHDPRRIHNPATGGTIALSERRTVAFKPGRLLKTSLNPRPSRVRRRR